MELEYAVTAKLVQGHRVAGIEPKHLGDYRYREIWKAAEKYEHPSPGLIREVNPSISITLLEGMQDDLVGESDNDLRKAILDSWSIRQLSYLYSEMENGNISRDEYIDSIIMLRSDGNTEVKEWRALGDATQCALDAIQNGRTLGLSTGYPSLDGHIGGMQKGALITVGGYTGIGKSALALNIALKVAKEHKVGIISLEMNSEEIAMRSLAILSGVPSRNIKEKNVSEEQVASVADAARMMDEEIDMWIDDNPSSNVSYIESVVRGNPPDLLIVDHLHLLTLGGKTRGYQEITEMSRRFKVLATELGIPIMLLVQLTKAPEGNKYRKPSDQDIKESGGIAQDSNVVLMVHRKSETDNMFRVSIPKNRDGSPGEAELYWEADLTRIRDPIELWDSEYANQP